MMNLRTENINWHLKNENEPIMHRVTIYAHGRCLNRTGTGGYAAVLRFEHDEVPGVKGLRGSYEFTTKHRIEMLSVIKALRAIEQPCRINIVTDSPHVVKGLQSEENKTANTTGKLGRDADLWAELFHLCERHQVTVESTVVFSKSQEGQYCQSRAYVSATNPQMEHDLFEDEVKMYFSPFQPECDSIEDYKKNGELRAALAGELKKWANPDPAGYLGD